jgi:nucleoside-diphosphate-sugar epimerase
MEILVTGANGFLGNHIVNGLTNSHKISSLSRTFGVYKVSLENEVPIFNHKFNMVIHAAGKAHSNPKTDQEKQSFYDVNVLGTQNLLVGITNIGVPEQFVFISSVSVYGKDFGENIPDDLPLMAKDAYGRSKIEAERLVVDWCYKNNVICTILRLPLLVGQNPPGNLGNMLKAIKKGYYFNIGGGKAKKSMVLAEDVVQFIPLIAPLGGTYVLTDGINPSFAALSHAIAKKKIINLPFFVAKAMGFIGDIIGERAPINSLKLKKITSDLTFIDSKARKLGWEPRSVLKYLKTNDL